MQLQKLRPENCQSPLASDPSGSHALTVSVPAAWKGIEMFYIDVIIMS